MLANEAHDIIARLECALEAVTNFFMKEFARFRPDGLNTTHLMLVYRLSKLKGPISAGMLHRKGYAGSNISYNLSLLLKKGYMTKKGDKHDLRSVIYCLTDKGLELAARLDPLVIGIEKNIGQLFPVESAVKFDHWLGLYGHSLVPEYREELPTPRSASDTVSA